MSKRFVLYQNNVYTNKQSDNFFGPDPMSVTMNHYYRDEDLYERLFDKNGRIRNFPDSTHMGIFALDKDETSTRTNYQRAIKHQQLDLSFMRKVILDDRYPVYVEYIRPFKRWTARRKTCLMLGEYQLTFGRSCLIQMIGSCRYEAALPEIREILLHGDITGKNRKLKFDAKYALSTFSPTLVVPILSELLMQTKTKIWFNRFLGMVSDFPSPLFIKSLNCRFEEYYYYYPEDYNELLYKCTIQQEILRACAYIPTISSLHLIEKGISHPYEHVEFCALIQIREWIKRTTNYMVKSSKDNSTLMRSITEAIWKYDISMDDYSIPNLRKKIHLFGESQLI